MRLRRSPEVIERDAFGNPAGTAPAPAPTFPRPLPPRPPRRARRRLLGGVGGLLGALLFFGPFLGAGWLVYKTIHDTVDHAAADFRQLDDRPHGPPATPRGLGRHSLLAPAAVSKLLRTARASPGGKLTLLRLAPDRADLQLLRGGGGLSVLELRWDGGRTLVRSPAGGTGSKAIIFSKVDRHAPARLVRAAAHRLGRTTSSIDYLVLLDVLDRPTWSAYFQGGAAFQADAHGRITGRIQ